MLVDLRYHDRVSAQIHNAVMRGVGVPWQNEFIHSMEH